MECLSSPQHEIDSSAELVRQDRQGLGFSVLPFEFLLELETFRIGPQEQHRSFREGPFQVRVSDLLALCSSSPQGSAPAPL